MHELSIMKHIVGAVINVCDKQNNYNVKDITLLVGEGRNFIQKWVQSYYDMLTKESEIYGATVNIETVPITVRCNNCGEIYPISLHNTKPIACTICGSDNYTLLTGYELLLKNIVFEEEKDFEQNK